MDVALPLLPWSKILGGVIGAMISVCLDGCNSISSRFYTCVSSENSGIGSVSLHQSAIELNWLS